MAERAIIHGGAIVKQSNIIARAGWKPFSVWEPRIVAVVAAQVRPEHEGFHEYEIPIIELLAAAGKSKSGDVYNTISNLVDKMLSRILRLNLKDEGMRSRKSYSLFCKSEYTEGGHSLTVQFHPDLKEHYLDLKKHFTRYSLTEYLSLPSIYSQRIYEILRSWDDRVSCEFDIDELHRILCTPRSLRRNFTDFRRWVLEKAHRDINSLTEMRYEWEAVTKSGEPPKKGRPVVRVRFIMGKKTMAKTKAVKKKAADKKQSVKNNRLFLSVVNCHHQPVSDGQCAHADGSEGCRYCLEILSREEPEKG